VNHYLDWLEAYVTGQTWKFVGHEPDVHILLAAGLRRARDSWRGRIKLAETAAEYEEKLRHAAQDETERLRERVAACEELIDRDGNAMDYVDARDEYRARYAGKAGG